MIGSLLALREREHWSFWETAWADYISLHGRGKSVFELQTSLCAFVNKLAIFVTREKTGDFVLFPHCKEFLATNDSEISFASVKQDLVQYLTNLQANFKERFPKLEEVSYRHVQFPFRVDAEACGDLSLEVAELQADENQKNSVWGLRFS